MSNEILQKAKESFHRSPAHIIEMNEVIAAFEGRTKRMINGDEWWSDVGDYDVFQWHPGDLNYHASWEWIMPVGKKCRETLESFSGDLLVCGFGYLYKIYEALQTFNTWKVHEALHNYIVWYNKNKGS